MSREEFTRAVNLLLRIREENSLPQANGSQEEAGKSEEEGKEEDKEEDKEEEEAQVCVCVCVCVCESMSL